MNDGWVQYLFLALAALVIFGVGLLVGFFGVAMVIHGEGFGWFVLLVSVGCFAGALRIAGCLLPERS